MTTATATLSSKNTPAFQRVLTYAPAAMVLFAALMLGLQALIVAKYYSDMIPDRVFNTDWRTGIAAIASIAFKGVAFSLLFMTVRDFSEGRSRVGWSGMIVTFLLNGYFILECWQIANAWTDANHPETWWHIFPFAVAGTVVVLFMEWRLAISVNSAQQAETTQRTIAEQLEQERKKVQEITGKIALYEAEKQRAEQTEQQRLAQLQEEQRLREKQELEAQERQRLEQMEAAKREADELRERLARMEKKAAAAERPANMHHNARVNISGIQKAVQDFYRKNQAAPTQAQIAKLLNVEERTIRNQFQNGSWKQLLQELQPEETANS